MHLCRERPRLRPVHHDLDEPHRARVGTQPATRLTGLRIQAGDPHLVPVAGQRGQLDDRSVGTGHEPPSDAGAFGEVVVVAKSGGGAQHLVGGSSASEGAIWPGHTGGSAGSPRGVDTPPSLTCAVGAGQPDPRSTGGGAGGQI